MMFTRAVTIDFVARSSVSAPVKLTAPRGPKARLTRCADNIATATAFWWGEIPDMKDKSDGLICVVTGSTKSRSGTKFFEAIVSIVTNPDGGQSAVPIARSKLYSEKIDALFELMAGSEAWVDLVCQDLFEGTAWGSKAV